MDKKITLNMLTQLSVSVDTQQITVINGEEYAVGQLSTKAYRNSPLGRSEVISELTKSQQDSIFAIWGESPLLEDNIEI